MTTSSPEPLPIVLYPDPFLTKTARPLTDAEIKAGRAGDWDLRELVERMKVTMYKERGVGLAAPQVGVGLRVFTWDISEERDDFHAVFNPVLSNQAGSETDEEGCLSIPGARAKVKRYAALTMTGTAPDGSPLKIDATELLARVFQHENDHLDGVLFINRLSVTGRVLLRRILGNLEADYEEAQFLKKKPKQA